MARAVARNKTFSEPPISFESAKWFCVTTNPNCQARAEHELYSLGYRTFVPKIRKWATHARVRKAVERPLLGRYMFVEVDYPRQSFGALKAVNGIETLLSNLGIPSPFPSHWVEGFLERYMAGEWDYVRQEAVIFKDEDGVLQTRQNEPIQIGARIRIIEGEFDNMLATVTNRRAGKLHCKILDTNVYTQLREHGVRAA